MTKSQQSYFWKTLPSPLGHLRLVGSDAGLAAILWENDDPKRVPLPLSGEAPNHPVLVEATRQLNEYFSGQRQSFDLPLDFHGTAFQKDVWSALLGVPYGQTRSYAQIAEQIGRPTATRAVGAANGRNPISIIAACHRIIGANGKLTGFAGGLDAKAWLLRLEGSLEDEDEPTLTGEPRITGDLFH